MDKITEELGLIKTNKLKYFYILIYSIIVSFGFVYYNVHITYLITFTGGLILLTIAFEKLEKELASIKMRNLYIKAKISLKINEMEKLIEKDNENFYKKTLQSLLNEIEV
jgi:magnesium-transporting ATPase (P-type)